MSDHETKAEGTDWEAAYAGEVPDTLVDAELMALAANLEPGTALDLGCGLGQNSIWLAQRGWTVHGVDIATGAIKRASAAARRADVSATFEMADLTAWSTAAHYDLVVSTYALPARGPGRSHALATAHDAVGPGGHVLVAEFDASLADTGWMAARDLVTIDEIRDALPGFDLVRAEVKVTNHSHGDHSEQLPVVVVVARRPGAER